MSRLSKCRRMIVMFMLFLALLLGAISFGGSALATEGGGNAYPIGAEDFMVSALPPPGTYLLNYFDCYRAKSFRGEDGDRLMPKFELTAIANVFRLIHVTNIKILGATYGMHMFLPITYLNVDASMGKDHRTGVGDIIVDPFVFGWHFPNFHVIAACDIWIPVGAYDKHRLANPGRNCWTFEPVLSMSYLSDSGIEVSTKLMYDFNTQNKATDYRSGQEFHIDYNLAYHFNPCFAFGANGYYYQQTTDDKQDGDTVSPDGFKGRVVGVGPAAIYNYKNMSFMFKWQKEFAVENRPEGNNFWCKILYAF